MGKLQDYTTAICVFTDEEYETQKKMLENPKGVGFFTKVKISPLINISFLDEIKPDFFEFLSKMWIDDVLKNKYSGEHNVFFSDESVNKLNIQESDLFDRDNLDTKFFFIVNTYLGNCFVEVKSNVVDNKTTLTSQNMDGLKLIKILKDLENGDQTYSEDWEDIKE